MSTDSDADDSAATEDQRMVCPVKPLVDMSNADAVFEAFFGDDLNDPELSELRKDPDKRAFTKAMIEYYRNSLEEKKSKNKHYCELNHFQINL